MKTKNCSDCKRNGKMNYCKLCKKYTGKSKHHVWWMENIPTNPNYVQIYGCQNSDFLYGDDGDVY